MQIYQNNIVLGPDCFKRRRFELYLKIKNKKRNNVVLCPTDIKLLHFGSGFHKEEPLFLHFPTLPKNLKKRRRGEEEEEEEEGEEGEGETGE